MYTSAADTGTQAAGDAGVAAAQPQPPQQQQQTEGTLLLSSSTVVVFNSHAFNSWLMQILQFILFFPQMCAVETWQVSPSYVHCCWCCNLTANPQITTQPNTINWNDHLTYWFSTTLLRYTKQQHFSFYYSIQFKRDDFNCIDKKWGMLSAGQSCW